MELASTAALGGGNPSASSVRANADCADSRNAPFFIVGCGRSGTTLLRLIMAGHSRLHIPLETHCIRRLVDDFPLDQPLRPVQLDAVVERIVTHPRWAIMEISAEQFRLETKELVRPRLSSVLDIIYHNQLRNVKKVRFGDKTPDYVRIIPQLLSIYPDAKFVNLIRDGHDVARSFALLGWGQAYHGQRFEWIQAVRATLVYRSAPFADRILEVRYEEMISNLEGTIRRVCAFLGEEFEPDMLNWQDRVQALFQNNVPELHRKLCEPLRPEEVGAWGHTLSAVECFLIEASLFQELEAIGYELRFQGLFWRPLLLCVHPVMHVLAPLLDLVLPAMLRRNYLPRPLFI
jgi:hypothetical protein